LLYISIFLKKQNAKENKIFVNSQGFFRGKEKKGKIIYNPM